MINYRRKGKYFFALNNVFCLFFSIKTLKKLKKSCLGGKIPHFWGKRYRSTPNFSSLCTVPFGST